MKKRICFSLVGSIVISMLLAGCGGGSDKSYSAENYSEAMATAEEAAYDSEFSYGDDVYEVSASSGASNGSDEVATDEQLAANSNRKLIRTVNLSVETREFDTLVANVQSKIKQLGGYAENTNISGNSYTYTSNRSAYIVARIPQDKVDSFVSVLEEETNITSKSESAEDVTLSYADIEARKESLRIEQTRLNELLEQADSLETIIILEQRLTEVRYEIESYESRLRTMDNQVTYSTININISEVKEYKPEPVENPTFGERLSKEFLDSCEGAFETIQDFFIGFIAFLPRLLVLIIILGIIGSIIFGFVKLVVFVIKKLSANKPAKQRKKPIVATIVEDKADIKKDEIITEIITDEIINPSEKLTDDK